MSTSTQPFPAFERPPLEVPAGAFEVLVYLCVVAAGTLCFLLGWLTPEGAGVVTVGLLASLIVLAWKRLGEGRHPCFLFLCALLFFQGGRLVAYCLGELDDPLRIELMTPVPFGATRNEAGVVLLLLVLSAICIYAPCRWNYRPITPPDDAQTRRYLPYLYLLFYGALPIQIFKNYRYYQYVQDHGGYSAIFVRHGDLAASVPFLVRLIPLISFPALLAIFVFEKRKKLLYVTTTLYFAASSLILLLGSRVATFGLVVTLWYVARIKSTKKARILMAAALMLVLLLVADVIQTVRTGSEDFSTYAFVPVEVMASQGISLNVTEVAVIYREYFSRHVASYLFHDLLAAFEVADASNFSPGRRFDADMAVFLNPDIYNAGYGTGGAYVAEAYVAGGVLGVVVASLLLGAGMHLLHTYSRSALGLFLVAMLLPEIFYMPRGALLGWISVTIRNSISVVLLVAGWWLYELLCSIRRTPRQVDLHAGGRPEGSGGEAWSR